MVINRRIWFVVLAGGLAGVALGFGLSAQTNPADPGVPRKTVRVQVPAATDGASSFADYDLAAGDDFLVSATPTHVTTGPTVSDQRIDPTAEVLAARRALERTPAEDATDGAAFPTASGNLVALPVDFALAPGTYPLVESEGAASAGASDQINFPEFEVAGSEVDDFDMRLGPGAGPDPTPTLSPISALANRLYATSLLP